MLQVHKVICEKWESDLWTITLPASCSKLSWRTYYAGCQKLQLADSLWYSWKAATKAQQNQYQRQIQAWPMPCPYSTIIRSCHFGYMPTLWATVAHNSCVRPLECIVDFKVRRALLAPHITIRMNSVESSNSALIADGPTAFLTICMTETFSRSCSQTCKTPR